VADQLREALAEGRLTPDEHAERIDRVYAARTYAELAPIVEDLPASGTPAPSPADAAQPGIRVQGDPALPAPNRQSASMVAIFSGSERKGRWLVEPNTQVLNVFSGTVLDFRQAVLSQREVTVNILCIFGSVEIKVPPGVRVVADGSAIFSSHSVPGDDPLEPDAPVIRLTGATLFGSVEVKRTVDAGKLAMLELRTRARELRAARRELRRNRRQRG
jgi:uncharacterized protein DUF1707/cell wall-active antibiotic response 4TMS protein YvqF